MLRKPSLVPASPGGDASAWAKTQMEEPKPPGGEGRASTLPGKWRGRKGGMPPKPPQPQALGSLSLPGSSSSLCPRGDSHELRGPRAIPYLQIHPCFSKGESCSESLRAPWPAARGWEIGSLVRPCRRGRHGALRDRQGIFAEQSFPRQVMRLFLAWNLLPQLPSAPDC